MRDALAVLQRGDHFARKMFWIAGVRVNSVIDLLRESKNVRIAISLELGEPEFLMDERTRDRVLNAELRAIAAGRTPPFGDRFAHDRNRMRWYQSLDVRDIGGLDAVLARKRDGRIDARDIELARGQSV